MVKLIQRRLGLIVMAATTVLVVGVTLFEPRGLGLLLVALLVGIILADLIKQQLRGPR
ncbi:MAG: hypothetical protein AB7M12_00580 [Hyphomonadaceae bacterium]